MRPIISVLAFTASCAQAQYYRIEAPSTHLKVECCRDIDEDTYGDPKGTCAEHGFKQSCTSCMLAMEFKVKDPNTCDQKHTQCYFRAPSEKCVGSSSCPYTMYDTNVTQQTLPDPSSILGKLTCSVLLDKQREKRWVAGFCSIGPNPELPECIKEIEAQWDKFAAKCSRQAFPDPSSILGKLSCSVLLDKQREKTWVAGFCNIGPNPELPECIKEIEAQWDKLAAKCSQAITV